MEGVESEKLQAPVRAARAKLVPVIRLRKHVAADSTQASIEPYPEAGGFKGILRRTVQIAKRHRDIMFVDDMEAAPLSVIITTLTSRSYEWCVTNREYDNELDLLFDVVRHMPDTIEMRRVEGSDRGSSRGSRIAIRGRRLRRPKRSVMAHHAILPAANVAKVTKLPSKMANCV